MSKLLFLQTGDYVLYDGEVHEVEKYEGGLGVDLYAIDDADMPKVQGIELTDEVLTLCGFKFVKGGGLFQDHYLYDDGRCRCILYNNQVHIVSGNECQLDKRNIEYLHQIQQCMRVATNELDFIYFNSEGIDKLRKIVINQIKPV